MSTGFYAGTAEISVTGEHKKAWGSYIFYAAINGGFNLCPTDFYALFNMGFDAQSNENSR